LIRLNLLSEVLAELDRSLLLWSRHFHCCFSSVSTTLVRFQSDATAPLAGFSLAPIQPAEGWVHSGVRRIMVVLVGWKAIDKPLLLS